MQDITGMLDPAFCSVELLGHESERHSEMWAAGE